MRNLSSTAPGAVLMSFYQGKSQEDIEGNCSASCRATQFSVDHSPADQFPAVMYNFVGVLLNFHHFTDIERPAIAFLKPNVGESARFQQNTDLALSYQNMADQIPTE